MAGDCTLPSPATTSVPATFSSSKATPIGQCTFSARAPCSLRDRRAAGKQPHCILRAGSVVGEPGMFQRRRTHGQRRGDDALLGVGAARTSTRRVLSAPLAGARAAAVQPVASCPRACATTWSGKSRSPEALTLADHPDRDCGVLGGIATLMRSERPGLTPSRGASPRPTPAAPADPTTPACRPRPAPRHHAAW